MVVRGWESTPDEVRQLSAKEGFGVFSQSDVVFCHHGLVGNILTSLQQSSKTISEHRCVSSGL